MRTIVAAIALLLALAGCTTKHPFFGSDMPDPTEPACAAVGAIPDSPAPAPAVPPGKVVSQISVSFVAVRFGPGATCDLTVPMMVQVHLYGTADGAPTFHGPNGDPLPYDALKTTPWTTAFFLSHSVGTAPTVMIDASAAVQDSPINPAPTDVMLRCVVRYHGNPIATDPKGPPLPVGNRFVRCNVSFAAPV
jgi:hypothetical protein